MDVKNLFWGLVLKPGKRYEQTVEESFHVSKACIEPTSSSGKVASVYVEVDNEEFLLCSLINPAVLNENLDLNFSEEEKICFRVEGEGTVHLTGYLVPDDDNLYDPSYAMSDDDEEDEELVERDLSSLVKKRKISNGDSSPVNNAKKGKLSPSVKAAKGSKSDAKSNEIKQAEAMKKILTAKKPSEEESDEDSSEAGSDDDSEDIEDMAMEYGEEEEEDSDEDLEGEEEEEDSDEGSEEEDEEEMEDDEMECSIEKGKNQTPAKKTSQKEGARAAEGTPKNQKTPQGKGKKTPSLKETPKVQEKPLKESTETPSKSAKKNKNKNKNNESKSGSSPATNGEAKAANRNGVTPSKGGKGDATPKTKAKTPMRTLKGGLMVEDLKVGDGPEAAKGKMVGMYYEGRLKSNNKKFDEQKSGKHFRFRLGAGEVIKGWDAGVEGMKVGGKRRLTVPPNMAYGQQGALPEIPSNSTLVFEVECKAVN